ncbi:MAG TPA: hypothetical protein VGM10_06195 [Actinocrinis sp.]|jgi:hypothetical protein
MVAKRRVLLLYLVLGAGTALMLAVCAFLTTSSAGFQSSVL